MEEETLMLLSMKDSKAVADALSNKTAQKILAYITKNKEATESELSEKLKVPLPTIHYNIQQLKKSNLIKSKEFFWSKKGKKMRVFTLAKKYIIISPSKSKSSLKQLKGLLPVALISIIGAGLLSTFQKSKTTLFDRGQELAANIQPETMGKTLAEDSTFNGLTQKAADEIANNMTEFCQLYPDSCIISEPNIALWFLIGSLFAIVLVFITNKIKKN
ncbi:helix-turn-helix domain-containing protein [archaeon]|nr:helix-turn-helix domain-containing protein [archaeon]